MLLNSYAKINLYLKIGKKLKSGYHNIQSLMQHIQLHDHISFESLDENKIMVESNNKDLESKNNLAYKAALILKNKFNIKEGVRITIEKQIPLASGLGGGSSNAANTLITLDKLWKLELSHKKLVSFALEIGSDVPFFIAGKSALVEGMGDKIKLLKKSLSANVVLVNPGLKVSTSWAYREFDIMKIKDFRDTKNLRFFRENKSKEKNKKNVKDLINAISKKDIKKISENMYNDFDAIIGKKYKITGEIKKNFRKFGALTSMISGSGPTVIGMFDSIYTARESYFKLKDMYPFVYLTKTF